MIEEMTFVGQLHHILEECAEYIRENHLRFDMEETSVIIIPVDEARRWEIRLYTVRIPHAAPD